LALVVIVVDTRAAVVKRPQINDPMPNPCRLPLALLLQAICPIVKERARAER